MNPGVYRDIPAAEYHRSPGVSNSMLKHLSRSPAHLQAYLSEPQEQTKPMLIGSITHHLILEPSKPPFWVVQPEGMDGRTKAGKEWKEAHAGASIISHEEAQSISRMVDSIITHQTARRCFLGGDCEVSLYAPHEETGVLRRARLDFVSQGNALSDLKTCEDARPEAFQRQMAGLQYHMQAAYYLDLWNDLNPDDRKECFVFVAVEKESPHAIGVYNLLPGAIEDGRREYRKLLALYAHCAAMGEWPGYSPDVQDLDLPAWARKKNHPEETLSGPN